MTREQLTDRLESLNRRAQNCNSWLLTAAADDPRRARAESDWAGLMLEMAHVRVVLDALGRCDEPAVILFTPAEVA